MHNDSTPCRPPRGTKRGTFHWLRYRKEWPPEVFEWISVREGWLRHGVTEALAVSDVRKAGWRYVGRCVPPKIEEDKR